MAGFGGSFMGSLGSSLGNSLGGAFDNLLGNNDVHTAQNSRTSGTKTVKRDFSQQAVDKLIYDIMSSDQGLAALAGAENASGGYSSSSKTLLAQDLVAKIVGEVAQITAPTTETTDSTTDSNGSSKKGSVICTEMHARGFIADWRYQAGNKVFDKLNPLVVKGYHFWAVPFVEKAMKNDSKLKWHYRFIPWVFGRYEYCVFGTFNLRGFLTVVVGHPICWTLGAVLATAEKLGVANGRSSNVTA